MSSFVKADNKFLGSFLLLLMLMIATVASTPMLGKSIWFVLPLILSLIYILNVANYNSLMRGVIVYLIIVISYRLIGVSDAGLGDYMQHIFFFIPIFFMIYLYRIKSSSNKKKCWYLMMLVMAINVFVNIYMSIKYPSINLKSVRMFYGEDFLQSMNIGGSKFFNFVFFFYMVCFFVFLNTEKKRIKIAMLVISLMSGTYILAFCYKASVMLFLILITVFLIYAKRTKRILRLAIISLFSGIIGMVIISNYENEVIEMIIKMSPDQRVTQRLVTLVDSEADEANDATVTGRSELYQMSIETWIATPANFVFGIGDHRSQNNARATGISQHSDLLDSLARYGLIGLLLLFLIFKKSFIFISSFFDRRLQIQLYCIFGVTIMFGLMKSLFTPAIGCVFFLLLPLSSNFVNKQIQ